MSAVSFGWLKTGNKKHPTWDNTILGNIKISGRSLVAEVNSEAHAARLRAEIEQRLGPSAVHQSTTARTVHELLAASSNRGRSSRAEENDRYAEEVLRNPEVKARLQESIQNQANSWITQKIPALRGRTPVQAVKDPDGKEIVESLLLDWERHAAGGAYQPGLAPDISTLRKLLNLEPPDPSSGS